MSQGSFAAVVPVRSAIAIHTGALGPKSVAVTFNENATTTYGEVSQ